MPPIDSRVQLLIQAAAFGLVLALWMAGVILWQMHRSRRLRRLQERLGLVAPIAADQRVLGLWHEGEVVETTVPRGRKPTLWQRLEQMGEDAGWSLPMGSILLLVALAAGLSAVAVLVLFRNPILAAAAGVLWIIGFRTCLLHRLGSRALLFDMQLIAALDLGTRSLRAGHPLNSAFQLISEEIDLPVKRIFAEIIEQETLGLSLQQALAEAAERSRNPDLQIFAASVIMQLRSGGNLAEMMDRVAWVIRERMRLHRRARVLATEAQLSKWVLLALPLFVLVLLSVLNPNYMRTLYTTLPGMILMGGSALAMIIGGWIMNRMAHIDY